jgi:hypothetical protein
MAFPARSTASMYQTSPFWPCHHSTRCSHTLTARATWAMLSPEQFSGVSLSLCQCAQLNGLLTVVFRSTMPAQFQEQGNAGAAVVGTDERLVPIPLVVFLVGDRAGVVVRADDDAPSVTNPRANVAPKDEKPDEPSEVKRELTDEEIAAVAGGVGCHQNSF